MLRKSHASSGFPTPCELQTFSLPPPQEIPTQIQQISFAGVPATSSNLLAMQPLSPMLQSLPNPYSSSNPELHHIDEAVCHYSTTAVASIPPPIVSIDESGLVKMTIIIPDYLAGGLFGKEGCIIKSFTLRTGSMIRTSQRGETLQGFPDHRAFWVFGTHTQVTYCASFLFP